jgi:hypothetical protein
MKMHEVVVFPEDFGTELKLRAIKNMDSATDSPCVKREDGLFACLPDVYWIGNKHLLQFNPIRPQFQRVIESQGCSKSGTSSIAHYLNQHPMVQNIVGSNRARVTHSKEGHFWEVSEVNPKIKKIPKSELSFNLLPIRL